MGRRDGKVRGRSGTQGAGSESEEHGRGGGQCASGQPVRANKCGSYLCHVSVSIDMD
jgi:hypothetical protein